MKRTTRSSGKRGKQIPASMDRLSALPDEVVCHILSFLPTKLSLATSVLSSRWRSLWAHVPTLDFNGEHFKVNNYHYVSNREPQHSDIIHRFLWHYRSENMNTFRLSNMHCTEYQVETWVNIAIERNVQNLDISVSWETPLTLPRRLFTCKTLVDLKFSYFSCNPSIGNVSLPRLKKLQIYGECRVDEDLPHLLAGCPVLEDLIINHISFEDRNLGCLNISSPTIKRFTFCFHFHDYKVKINAPALEYFKVEDAVGEPTSSGSFKHISISPMASLVEADIFLHTYSLEEVDDYYTRSAVKFLSCLSNVKCLKLTGLYSEKYLDVAVAGSNVRFDNLSKLELKLDADWRFGLRLLDIADNLEALTVVVDEATIWMEPKQVPTYVSSRLKTIRIDGPVSTEHGFNMVRYFLRNAEVLERMEIFSKHHATDFKGKFDVIQRITLFERGSKSCQLAFY